MPRQLPSATALIHCRASSSCSPGKYRTSADTKVRRQMLGDISDVRIGDGRYLLDALVMVPDKTKVGDHRSETVPTREFRGVDDEAGKITRCLDLGVNRPGKFAEVLRRPRDDHRHTDGLNDRVADRPQECAGHGISAVTSDHDKLCRLRCFDERASWLIANEKPADSHVGIAFLPTRQRLANKTLCFCFDRRPVDTRKFDEFSGAPRVHCYQADATTGGFVKCDLGSEF